MFCSSFSSDASVLAKESMSYSDTGRSEVGGALAGEDFAGRGGRAFLYPVSVVASSFKAARASPRLDSSATCKKIQTTKLRNRIKTNSYRNSLRVTSIRCDFGRRLGNI